MRDLGSMYRMLHVHAICPSFCRQDRKTYALVVEVVVELEVQALDVFQGRHDLSRTKPQFHCHGLSLAIPTCWR